MQAQNKLWFQTTAVVAHGAVVAVVAEQGFDVLSFELVPSTAAFNLLVYPAWCLWWISMVRASMCGSKAS